MRKMQIESFPKTAEFNLDVYFSAGRIYHGFDTNAVQFHGLSAGKMYCSFRTNGVQFCILDFHHLLPLSLAIYFRFNII